MDKTLLTILACPSCKSSLSYQKSEQETGLQKPAALPYPIRDDIPVMLVEEARELTAEED